jgi:CheY-like chemotaxis protein
MDHMMPEMDGLETTQKLRAMGYSRPIIALTANAVAGQSDIFLQNGFDGFISKPIDLRHLNTILIEHVRNKYQYTEEAVNNNDQFIEPFIQDLSSTLAIFDELALKTEWYENSNDLNTFEIYAHGIKSALLIIGEQKLSEAALQLETAAGERRLDVIVDNLPEFVNDLRNLLEKLKIQIA